MPFEIPPSWGQTVGLRVQGGGNKMTLGFHTAERKTSDDLKARTQKLLRSGTVHSGTIHVG